MCRIFFFLTSVNLYFNGFTSMKDSDPIYYFNADNIKIDINSSYLVIIQEINRLGIDTSEITISALLDELDVLLSIKYKAIVQNKDYLKQIKEYNDYHNQIRVLFKHIIEDAFNLYSYDEDKMPIDIRRSFKNN